MKRAQEVLVSEEDIAAINKGYEQKEIIGRALMRDFKEPENYYEEEQRICC